MELEITLLNRYPCHVEQCATWAYDEWHKRNKTEYSIVKHDYKRRSKSQDMPVTLIALYSGKLVGMVTLKRQDLYNRHDLSPWLSALYVAKKFRKMGIGGTLVMRVLEEARKKSYSSVYLFTDRDNSAYLRAFYASLGWKDYALSRDVSLSYVTIMKYLFT